MINMRAKETQISLELRKKEKRIWRRAEKNELKSRRGKRCAADYKTCYNDHDLNGQLVLTQYF